MATGSDILFDTYLNVSTPIDANEDEEKGEDDNIYDATSYFFLERLFQTFPFKEEDHLVDFGCGKGRVLFMAAQYGCKEVTGLENSKYRYDILKTNVAQYQAKHGKETSFDIQHIDVREAVINDRANKLFFFDPFQLVIFDKVIKNITESLKRNQRDITIFLNLPQEETLEYLNNTGIFKNEIQVESSLYLSEDKLVTIPHYAFFANYSMAHIVDPNFLLY